MPHTRFRSAPRVVISGIALATLAVSPVHAEVCESSNKPGSCYIIKPTFELVTQGTVVAPLDHYVPYVWHGAEKQVDPPKANGSYVTKPGLSLRLGAGVWGEGAHEPMAIAQTTFAYTVETGVQFISRTDGNNGVWYRFPCEAGTPLCYQESTSGNQFEVWTPASALVRRSYRLTQLNPAPIPASVTHAPVLIDYRMSVVVNGTHEQGNETVPGLGAQTQVLFGFWEPFKNDLYNLKYKGVTAGNRTMGIYCSTYGFGEPLPTQGNTCAGTFLSEVPLSRRDLLVLIASAATSFDSSPICREADTPDGKQCLVRPWTASGHAVADPYVYIDPAWPYASWFKLEMATDDSDTSWVAPERTPIDTEKLMVLPDAGTPRGNDAGSTGGDASAANDAGGAARDAGAGGSDASGGNRDAVAGEDATAGQEQPAEDDAEDDPEDSDHAEPDEADTGAKDTPPEKSGGGGCQAGARNSSLPLWLGLLSAFGLCYSRARRSACYSHVSSRDLIAR